MELSKGSWDKVHEARRRLSACGRVIVAFSGGIDSTVLAVLAHRTLGADCVLAVTADSPSIARQDLHDATLLARRLGLRHQIIVTQEVRQPAYRDNTPQRCFVCKDELFTHLDRIGEARGIDAVVYGAIRDDLQNERPGQKAAWRHGVQAPLQEAGLEKWELRLVAKSWELPNWNKPQNACLSSRIPHGTEVTEARLRQIELAEAFLRGEGFSQVRVRHVWRHARIEVDAADVPRFDEATLAARAAHFFEAVGFESVGVDAAGYRLGGANGHPADERLLRLGGVAQPGRARDS